MIGFASWRKYALKLDLATETGSILVNGHLHGGNVQQTALAGISNTVVKVIENSDVDGYVPHELDVSQLSEDGAMREKLQKLIWQHREVLKGFEKIKSVQHKIKPKTGTNPVCCTYRRR